MNRIILSRKGFDSDAGGRPSPILPDGKLLSVHIPDKNGTTSYQELSFAGHNLGQLVTDIKARRSARRKKPLLATDRAHLDPDLIHSIRDRSPGWRAALGQAGKDATILRNHQVGMGDLFLFFGWFRQCEIVGGRYRFVRGAPDLHVIFGYLSVGEIIRPMFERTPEWLMEHPHLHGSERLNDPRNTLFIAAEKLELPGTTGLPGAGVFPRFHKTLQLTADGMSRSWWRVPEWFQHEPLLSSHEKAERWQALDDGACLLKSVGRGQEFVLDAERHPESIGWISTILRRGTASDERSKAQ